jgi:LmbE family N-acetylglucosaminyl deacetylase
MGSPGVDTPLNVDRTGDLGSILGVWAHPDDEAWLSSGLMMRAVEAGHRVVCVTATRGESGFPADDVRSAEERKAVRASELDSCLHLLGVDEHYFLDFDDGRCADVPDHQAVPRLLDIIADVTPDTVLSFGPDGATGHSDHISTCRWTTEAVRTSEPQTRLLYATTTKRWNKQFFTGFDPATIFMIDGFEPELLDEADLAVWFSCDQSHLPRKVAAMRAQASQIEPLVQALGVTTFSRLVQEEFFRSPTPDDADTIERMRLQTAPR